MPFPISGPYQVSIIANHFRDICIQYLLTFLLHKNVISKSSHVCNNENIGPSENFSRRIYKIPADFQELQTPCNHSSCIDDTINIWDCFISISLPVYMHLFNVYGWSRIKKRHYWPESCRTAGPSPRRLVTSWQQWCVPSWIEFRLMDWFGIGPCSGPIAAQSRFPTPGRAHTHTHTHICTSNLLLKISK